MNNKEKKTNLGHELKCYKKESLEISRLRIFNSMNMILCSSSLVLQRNNNITNMFDSPFYTTLMFTGILISAINTISLYKRKSENDDKIENLVKEIEKNKVKMIK